MDTEKEYKYVVRDLTARVDAFSSIEHLTTIENVLLPKLNHFENSFEFYKVDNFEMRSCIRSFDESMSSKANKVSLNILKEELWKLFIHQDDWTTLNQRIHDINTAMENS